MWRASEAATPVNRMDYGLAWKKPTEAGGFIGAHDVDIIEIAAALN